MLERVNRRGLTGSFQGERNQRGGVRGYSGHSSPEHGALRKEGYYRTRVRVVPRVLGFCGRSLVSAECLFNLGSCCCPKDFGGLLYSQKRYEFTITLRKMVYSEIVYKCTR